MGFGAVVVIENLASMAWGKRVDQRLLARLNVVPAWLALGWIALRLGDLAWRGRLGLVLGAGMYSAFFLLELALFLAAGVLQLSPRWRANRGRLFGSALLLLFGGALYRFDTYLLAYQPQPGWRYFPQVGEMAFSAGLAALGIAVFVLFVKLFPILSGVESPGDRHPSSVPAANTPAAGLHVAGER